MERKKLEQEKNQNLDPHRNLRLYHGEEEEEEEEKEDPERVSLRNPSTASFQELFNQNQLLYARRLGQPPEKQRSYFPPSPSPLGPSGGFGESETLREKARENPPSRLGRRSSAAAGGGGEIVEVQGGHIVRATGRKDRHSKVCTAKGPRDRRVRLAAHTAIQFYDVQDRLGYDRPSKAVDWLIKKAKAAIDELAELPAWHPTASAVPENAQKKKENDEQSGMHHAMLGGQNEQMSSFLPPSMDSDAIADTIKSFFPTGSGGEASSSAVEFHNFSAPGHNNSQDLRLSLQSFQDPIMLHHHHYTPPPNSNPNHHHHHSEQARAPQGQQQHVLLSGTPLGFDGWPPPPPWNSGGDPAAAGGSFQFNSPPPAQLFGSGQFFTSQQRGPLQSSNTPSLRAWMDPSAAITISMADHGQHHGQHPGSLPVYPSSAFASGYGYSGFHIPARIQGDEEEHDGYSDKPSSASSDSRH